MTATESNVGKWTPWWTDADPSPLGPEDSYRLGAAWLHGLAVEDWGTGTGYSRRFFPDELWAGIDGTGGAKQSVKVADLTTYRSSTPGLFMRHVLEHNENWRAVLRNALASFQKRMFLCIFTAPAPVTRVFNVVEELDGVVEVEFNFADIDQAIREYNLDADRTDLMPDVVYNRVILPPRGPFKAETVWFLQRGEG